VTTYYMNELGKVVKQKGNPWSKSKPKPVKNRLFVYGIFLNESNRNAYGMSNPRYATVANYITVGHHIVQAMKVEGHGIALTGLTVDVNPDKWPSIDSLESGYDRRLVSTDSKEEVYMYVAPEGEV
jgi:gamma-glutamylcyclotransferase (GGCT)/AIG2-like uncharacterized protein YtfP